MQRNFGKLAGRLALLAGLLVALSGCVVYPAGPGPYYHPYRCCWYR